MNIVGWILVVIGVIAFLAGLFMALREQLKKTEVAAIPQNRAIELKDIAEVLKQFAEVLKAFKDLSAGIQWAFLGLACIAVGAYILQGV
jgi:hypothetical protein